MIEKYIKIYVKRNFALAMFCSSIAFIPLFIVSLVYDVVAYDTAIAFAPFFISIVFCLLANLYIIRFKRMIKEQEILYNVQFEDCGFEHLETTLYLSNDWLIGAGSSAFNKKHILLIKTRVEYGRVGSSHRIIIETIDNKKYTIWCLNSKNIKKINKWLKSE